MNRTYNTVFLTWLCLLLSFSAQAVEKQGMLDWYQRLELSTPVSGLVMQVKVSPGDRVKKNQVLVALDPRPFQAQLKKAKAVLAQTRENFAEAKRELERAEELFERTAISVHDRELVRIEFTRAQANMQNAEAALTQAQLELEYSVVRAPMDALVVVVDTYPQQTRVHRFQAPPLVVLADLSHYRARVLVTIDELKSLQAGQEAQVKLEGKTYQAKIINPAYESLPGADARMYPLEVEFTAADKLFRKGQPVIVVLP